MPPRCPGPVSRVSRVRAGSSGWHPARGKYSPGKSRCNALRRFRSAGGGKGHRLCTSGKMRTLPRRGRSSAQYQPTCRSPRQPTFSAGGSRRPSTYDSGVLQHGAWPKKEVPGAGPAGGGAIGWIIGPASGQQGGAGGGGAGRLQHPWRELAHPAAVIKATAAAPVRNRCLMLTFVLLGTRGRRLAARVQCVKPCEISA
jgi:hypothetical protein